MTILMIFIYIFILLYLFLSFLNYDIQKWLKKSHHLNIFTSIHQSFNSTRRKFHGEFFKCDKIEDCLYNSDYNKYKTKKSIDRLFNKLNIN